MFQHILLTVSLLQVFVYFLEILPSLGRVKKQDIVSRSSTEAGYRALASTTTEIVWLRWLLSDMGCPLTEPTPMYYDNKSAIQIAHNSVFHERTNHIEIDCHFTSPSSAWHHHFTVYFFLLADCRFVHEDTFC
ncbi:hypothetical protein QL285_083530 [Trifolium repens]|nr:hypothetical protein QL285_083530 [Trifolium repens]